MRSNPVATILLAILIAVIAGLPLGWMLYHIVTRPEVWVELKPTAFRLDLMGRTLGYNLAAAVLATLLALPAAMVLGRGRGWVSSVLWFALPVSLFIPSIVYSYGWMQVLRIAGHLPDFQTPGDIARCIWSLATWLLPLPAFLIGLALRNVDADLQQQALLDGRLWRVTLRQLAGPIVAAVLMCTVLAVQEFAVYEPSGISVIATEVRMVFDTGAMAASGNPIIGEIAPVARELSTDQRSRAAAAVATAVPMLVVIAACGFAALKAAKTASAADAIDAGPWPNVLNAGAIPKTLAILVLLLTAGLPLVALVQSMYVAINPGFIFREYSPEVGGTLAVGAMTGAAAFVIALLATAGRSKLALVIALAAFLVGGQILAIALIRLYNRPIASGIYNSAAIAILAYLARFGWIPLIAGRFTTSPRWHDLRQMAAVDGAGPRHVATDVILPLAWPILLASAVCVMTLAMTEVPATVLLSPLRPRMLVPIMMTWVHIQRFDSMIEASLLMVSWAVILSIAIVILVRLATTRQHVPLPVPRERVG
jgi:ABC-type Fe3+ transport system permease subunit